MKTFLFVTSQLTDYVMKFRELGENDRLALDEFPDLTTTTSQPDDVVADDVSSDDVIKKNDEELLVEKLTREYEEERRWVSVL